MSIKRCIIVIQLDEQSRSTIKECLTPAHFEITELDDEASVASPERMDLMIVRAEDSPARMEEFCRELRARCVQNVPIMACVGRYTYPLIKPLLGNAFQSIIITPFKPEEFRKKLDEMDLGF